MVHSEWVGLRDHYARDGIPCSNPGEGSVGEYVPRTTGVSHQVLYLVDEYAVGFIARGEGLGHPYDGVAAARRQLDLDVIGGVDVEEVLLAVEGEPPWSTELHRHRNAKGGA